MTRPETGEGWLDVASLRELIRARFAVRGQPTEFARDVGILNETMLSFFRGSREPADELLAALGWERQTFYRRLAPCGCYTCTQARVDADPLPDQPSAFDPRLSRYFLCETCGNKRCPHGHDHRNACTNSNEPGQAGSGYEDSPSPPPHLSPSLNNREGRL